VSLSGSPRRALGARLLRARPACRLPGRALGGGLLVRTDVTDAVCGDGLPSCRLSGLLGGSLRGFRSGSWALDLRRTLGSRLRFHRFGLGLFRFPRCLLLRHRSLSWPKPAPLGPTSSPSSLQISWTWCEAFPWVARADASSTNYTASGRISSQTARWGQPHGRSPNSDRSWSTATEYWPLPSTPHQFSVAVGNRQVLLTTPKTFFECRWQLRLVALGVPPGIAPASTVGNVGGRTI